eukprot:2320250-Pyramimonas_sp.AAC.1
MLRRLGRGTPGSKIARISPKMWWESDNVTKERVVGTMLCKCRTMFHEEKVKCILYKIGDGRPAWELMPSMSQREIMHEWRATCQSAHMPNIA